MTIWLVGGVLVALAALLGFFLGAIRASVSLIGAVASAFLAKLVGGWVSGLVPLCGFKNPVWMFYLPPLFGFAVGSIFFLIVALVVHYLIQKRYRDNTDEYSYQRWDRLNRRTGAAVGAGVGAVWLVLVAMVAYVPGYLVAQLADTEEGSTPLRLANTITHDLEQSGFNRLVERFNPATTDHFVASDILGLIYHNPAIHSRLASYPPFLGLAEKKEIADLAKDPEINSLIQSKAGLSQILEHPKIVAVTDNTDLVNELLGLDFKDLDAYLRSGVSGKYKDEHILGRWRLNVRRSIAEMKLVPSDKLPAVEFNLLRKALNVYLEDMMIGFTTDNKALLKVKAKDEQKLLQTVGRASASAAPAGGAAGGGDAAAGGGEASRGGRAPGPGLSPRSIAARAIPQPQPQPQQQPGGGMSPELRQRYGLTGAGRGGGGGGASGGGATALANTAPVAVVPVKVAPKQTSTALGPMMSTGEGGWAKAGEGYKITVAKDGKEVVLEAVVKENQLIASHEGRTLVFDRI